MPAGVGALYERTSFRLEECAVIDRTYTTLEIRIRKTPSRKCGLAADVTLQLRDLELLVGDDVTHEVVDRNHP